MKLLSLHPILARHHYLCLGKEQTLTKGGKLLSKVGHIQHAYLRNKTATPETNFFLLINELRLPEDAYVVDLIEK
jgi:hypothetical protein